jgi:hypothetical protein
LIGWMFNSCSNKILCHKASCKCFRTGLLILLFCVHYLSLTFAITAVYTSYMFTYPVIECCMFTKIIAVLCLNKYENNYVGLKYYIYTDKLLIQSWYRAGYLFEISRPCAII